MTSVARRILGAAERAAARAAPHRPDVEMRVSSRRARLLEARIRLRAAWVGATVDVQIGSHVRVGRRIRLVIEPGSQNTLHVGDYCELDDDVRLQLKGGRIVMETGALLRRGVLLNVSGSLRLGEQAMLSWFTVVHCANDIHVARRAFIGEFTTLVDSAHYFTTPDEWAYGNVAPGHVVVGENTWIAAKATIARNVTVGSHCIVSASAVVIRDVPDGHLAAGVPAEIRPLDLPWNADTPDGTAQSPSSPS